MAAHRTTRRPDLLSTAASPTEAVPGSTPSTTPSNIRSGSVARPLGRFNHTAGIWTRKGDAGRRPSSTAVGERQVICPPRGWMGPVDPRTSPSSARQFEPLTEGSTGLAPSPSPLAASPMPPCSLQPFRLGRRVALRWRPIPVGRIPIGRQASPEVSVPAGCPFLQPGLHELIDMVGFSGLSRICGHLIGRTHAIDCRSPRGFGTPPDKRTSPPCRGTARRDACCG